MKYAFIFLIKVYRKWISPLKPPCCRFSPTCSAYALEAFTNRGFFGGLILSVKRILRCNPFSKPGYDPVPEKGFKRVPLCKNTEISAKPSGVDESHTARDKRADDPENEVK